METIKVAQFGCGPIGCSVIKYASQRPDMQIVGAVDMNPKLIGQDVGKVAAFGKDIGIPISGSLQELPVNAKPDVIFHTTRSSLAAVTPELIELAKFGVNVVSSCEELSYPYRKSPDLARKIDRAFKDHEVTVLGTGVNPGFLMDCWPLFMTAVCQQVDRVKIARIQNASTRRGPFQKKIGAGLSVDEFQKLVNEGTIRHVGLPESVAHIADGLGWKLDDITEEIGPIIAKDTITTDYVTVKRSFVSGVRQIGKGVRGNNELITLIFEASVDAPESYDAVQIIGTPNMEVIIKGGTHGDIATAAIVVNAARRVMNAAPGLVAMKDLPVITAVGH